MPPLPRRSIRAISASLLISGLLAACTDQAGPATPTVVRSGVPTLPAVPTPNGGRSVAPVAPSNDSTTLLTALNLPRLDGVTLRVLVWSGSYKNLFTAFGRVTGATMKITEITSTDEQL